VPLFQEQMLRIAMIMADFDGGEAEELRRAISFHRSPERMEKVVAKLRHNMTRKLITPEVQERIIASLSSFALYGFPESHAISFALLAYASCWLKVHRPSEFYCARCSTISRWVFYSPATLVKDGKRRGIKFRPVCIICSGEQCIIEEDNSVRLGLNYAKGLSSENAENIVSERKKFLFAGLADFLRRVPLTKVRGESSPRSAP
jgi:error-prone DNA polymerase